MNRRTRLAGVGRGWSRRRRAFAGYGMAGVAWLVSLVLIPLLGQEVMQQRAAHPPQPILEGQQSGPGETTAATRAASSPGTPEVAGGAAIARPDGDLASPPVEDHDLGISPEGTFDVDLDQFLPEPLDLPIQELPPAFLPLLVPFGPAIGQVCAMVGVTLILPGLTGDLNEPLSEAVRQLRPVLQACALFPLPDRTVCSFDTGINNAIIPEDLQILVPVPGIGGLIYDHLLAMEQALGPLGPLTQPVREAIGEVFGCG